MDLYILDPESGEPLGTLDTYADLEWKVRYISGGSFKATVPSSPTALGLAQKGRMVYIAGDTYRIDQVEAQELDTFQLTGNEAFPERVCLPPAGLSHDVQTDVAAETAMKHYVDANAGPSASAGRRIDSLAIATDLAQGPLVTYRARYKDLIDVVTDIAQLSALGWRLSFDRAGTFTFDAYEGADRSSEVFFDLEFDTLVKLKFLSSILGRKNYAYVGGQGEAETREIVETYVDATEPVGFARRETFIDARDIDDTDALSQRGDTKLSETKVEDAFEVDVNQFGSFRYNRDWFLGDIVLLRNRTWSIERAARVVGIVNKVGSASSTIERSVELDRPWPTLKERVEESATKPTGSALS